MLTATDLKRGMVIRHQGHLSQILSTDFHQGGGKMGGLQHVRLRNLETGAVIEVRLRPDEKAEVVDIDRKRLEYIYQDGEFFVFMSPETFDQAPVHSSLLGDKTRFLKEGTEVTGLFFEGNPVTLEFPEHVDLRVTTSPPPRHDQETSTYKSVTLENGMEILAPQFIKEGDILRVDTEAGKYMERVAG